MKSWYRTLSGSHGPSFRIRPKNCLKRPLAEKSRWRHIRLAIKPRYLGNHTPLQYDVTRNITTTCGYIGGTIHWHKDNVDDAAASNQGAFVFIPPYQQAPSLDIETTSYALLTYAHLGNLTGGIPIAKWIVAQRNADGGFSSTQVCWDVLL